MMACFTVLAAQSDDRMVLYYPNHATVRLVWKRTSLRFTIDEFRLFAASLEQSLRQIAECANGLYELRIDDTTLHVQPIDFWMLGGMVEAAWHQLTHGKHDAARPWSENSYRWN